MENPNAIEIVSKYVALLGGISVGALTLLKILKETLFKEKDNLTDSVDLKKIEDNANEIKGLGNKVSKRKDEISMIDDKLIKLEEIIKYKQNNQQVNSTVTDRLKQHISQFCNPRCESCGRGNDTMEKTLRREIQAQGETTEKLLMAAKDSIMSGVTGVVDKQLRDAFDKILESQKSS